MGFEAVEGGAIGKERSTEVPGVSLDTIEVQVALARRAFELANKVPCVNSTDAVEEWVGGFPITEESDKNSPAARFREYIKKHPHERINVEDKAALEQLLTNLVPAEQVAH